MTAVGVARLLLRWGLPIGAIGYLGYLLAGSDLTQFLAHLRPTTLFVAAVSAVVYAIAFYLLAVAWSLTLRHSAPASVDLLAAIHGYALANFAKYLPGNVFHYVGRQVVAARMGCSQKAAARATALEIALHLVAAGSLLALLLPFASDDLGWLRSVMDLSVSLWPLLLLAAAGGGGALFYFRVGRNDQTRPNLDLRLLAILLCLQLAFFTVATLLGAWLAVSLLQAPVSSLPAIAFAWLFAWLVAFVVPGAPAGLGVREACLAAALQAYGEISTILVFVALSRVVLLVGEGFFALSARLLRSKAGRPATA